MCKDTKTAKLKSHIPHEDFTLVIRWPDEDEVDNYTVEMSLKDYLNGMKPVWADENGDPKVTYEDYVRLQKSLKHVTNILRDLVPKCSYMDCTRIATYQFTDEQGDAMYCGHHGNKIKGAYRVEKLVKANLALMI